MITYFIKMKQKKLYLRRKDGKRLCYETKVNNKTTHLIDLPKDHYKFIDELSRLLINLCPDCRTHTKASFFNKEKWEKIRTILQSADDRYNSDENNGSRVRTTITKRIPNKSDFYDEDDELNELSEKAGKYLE